MRAVIYLNFENSTHDMPNKFSAVVKKGEEGYLISEVVGLPGCHTQAKTYDELIKRTKKAIHLYVKAKKIEFSQRIREAWKSHDKGEFKSLPANKFLKLIKKC
ncbi:MAG: type II toxin-antitoxin system HicB family antitoxin [Nanoarchaeota archaeon]